MSNPPHIPAALPSAPAHHIGAELRACREAKGLTYDQIGAALKIQASYVKAIEALDTDALPAAGYVLGYVRSYANYVGLNGAQAAARYKADSATPLDLGRSRLPHFVPKTKIRLPRGFIPALTVLGCAAVLTFWYSSNTPSIAAPATVTDMLDEAAYAPDALPDDPSILTLKAVAPSWIQVSDAAGRPVMSRIMVTGESWSTNEPRLTLSVRDGAAIELYAGRERLGPFGQKGVAFAGMPLSVDAVSPDDLTTQMTPIITD